MNPPSPDEGDQEPQGPMYRVCLTLVASINPEYDAFVSNEWADSHSIPRVLQRHIEGEQSRDNSVSTALMACSIGQIIRKQLAPDKINAILEFSTMRPRERFENIREGLSVGLGTTKSISLLTLRH
jgi:hypothetical protein